MALRWGAGRRRRPGPDPARPLVGRGSGLDGGERLGGGVRDPAGRGCHPGLIFVPVAEGKRTKNRLHIDLRPDGVRDSEVARLLMLGATRVDVGQHRVPADEVSWTVLADPEGNEFCVLGERRT